MAKKLASPRLTAGELEIMDLLWKQGPLTLSEAHQSIGRRLGYTTVQTRLNRLVDKGLVTRSMDRPAEYGAAVAREAVSAKHLDTLLEWVTGGSVVPLVAHLVTESSLKPEEIKEIKRLIAQAERANRESGEEAS